MSGAALVSPATRFDANEKNATQRPSAEIDGYCEAPSGAAPPTPWLTRYVAKATPGPAPAAAL